MAEPSKKADAILYAPCVYIIGSDYRIVFPTDRTGMAWVTAGDKRYADSETGLMRWNTVLHAITVPQSVLDEAGEYTIHFSAMSMRYPYYGKSEPYELPEEEISRTYPFTPMDTSEGIKLYHLSDTHGQYEAPVACANQFPDHTLVFDGDIASHNSTSEDLYLLFKINEGVTGGKKPILFSRGNHDSRGPMAWMLPQMIPTENGNTYFSFRVGDLWGVALDCGEDKYDDHIEYGGTTDFEPYRIAETAWLDDVTASGAWKSAKYRIAICHVPFTQVSPPPFDIEQDKYSRWTECLNKMGVRMLLSGHIHRAYITHPGDKMDAFGQQFPTVVGAALERGGVFKGTAIEITQDALHVRLTDAEGKVYLEETL